MSDLAVVGRDAKLGMPGRAAARPRARQPAPLLPPARPGAGPPPAAHRRHGHRRRASSTSVCSPRCATPTSVAERTELWADEGRAHAGRRPRHRQDRASPSSSRARRYVGEEATGFLVHAFATNLRFEDDEFNFVKTRAKHRHQRGVQGARRALRGRRSDVNRVDPAGRSRRRCSRRQPRRAASPRSRTSPATSARSTATTPPHVRPRPRTRPRCRRRRRRDPRAGRRRRSAGVDPVDGDRPARPSPTTCCTGSSSSAPASRSTPSTSTWCARRPTSTATTAAASSGSRRPAPTSSTASTSGSSAPASAGSAPPSGSSRPASRTRCSRRTPASAARGSRTRTPTSASTCPTTSTRTRSRPIADWSDYYARRDELADYIERCADEYGVLPHVRFGTEVLAATYDDERARWTVQRPRERRA